LIDYAVRPACDGSESTTFATRARR
jgi:hypothetical protein